MFIFLAVLLWASSVISDPGAGAWIAALGAAIGIPVGVSALSQILTPTTPRLASAPACYGAPVAGGGFLATTPPGGINARSGPDTTYPQVNRFAGNCTLSFDGYCIGESVDDLVLTNYSDERWLIVHRPWVSFGGPAWQFVAAGKVQSQSPESSVGNRPAQPCAQLGGWKRTASLRLDATLSRGVVAMRARAAHPLLIGFSIMTAPPPEDGGSVFALTDPGPKRTDPSGSVKATWLAQAVTGPTIGARPARLIVAAVCLAPAVPDSGDYQAKALHWSGSRVAMRAQPPALTAGDISRLQTAACLIAPDYPHKSV